MIDTNLPPATKRRGRTLTTVAATATAAALAFGFSAGPAFAEGATGQYVGNAATGHKVTMDGKTIGTTLFNLKMDDGGALKAYCIDFETTIVTRAKYEEDDWANYPGKGDFAKPAKVHWILQNAYPTVGVGELAKQSGVKGLSEKDAVAGTQAAIWHFSNDVELKKSHKHENVKALYDYLVEEAEELPQTGEPDASLAISPGSAEGKAGETIGEFTVETSAESLPLDLDAPEGVELVDLESGEAVETVGNGDTFGVQVPEGTEPGEATISASVSTEVHAGRLFRGLKDKPETQTLITAETGEATVTGEAKVTWAEGSKPEPSPEPSDEPEPSPEPSDEPEPTPEPSDEPEAPGDDKPKPEKPEDKGGLPVTGAALGGLVAAAVAAIGGGGTAMYLSRKRRNAAADTTEE